MTPERLEQIKSDHYITEANQRELIAHIEALEAMVGESSRIAFEEGIHLAALYFETARSVIDLNAGYTTRHRTPAEIESYADAMKATLSKDWEKHKARILAIAPAHPPQKGCPRDTDGDGNCGRPYCPHCGTEKATPAQEPKETK